MIGTLHVLQLTLYGIKHFTVVEEVVVFKKLFTLYN